MDFRQFEYLTALDDSRSFSIAADNLFITRNTLVYFLSKMEAEIGAELFYRTKQGLHPTEIGQCYIDMANKVLNERRYCQQTVSEKMASLQSTLRVATIEAYADYMLPHIIMEFQKECPGIHIDTPLLQDDADICKSVMMGNVDIGISNQPSDGLISAYADTLEFAAPLSCPLMLAVPKDFPLPLDLESDPSQPVDIRRFYGETFFIPLYRITADLLAECGTPPQMQRPQTARAAFEYIKNGAGVGLITPLSIADRNAVRCFPIKSRKPLRNTYYVIHRKDMILTKGIQTFIKIRKQQWLKDYGWADDLLKKD